MDSINKQQPENNHQDLQSAQAVDKIRELAKGKTCFFCTNIRTGSPVTTRPMSVQQVDDQGNLWFLSSTDSHKNEDLTTDPMVQLLFQGSEHSDFLSLYGRAAISRDKAKIEELWEPLLKTWFTGGKDDPRISVIQIQPTEGYYWDNKHGNAVAFLKIVAGAITGKTLDDSIEGNLQVR